MPTKTKNSSKTDVFWERFEKSGSIKAYLKYQEARQQELLADEIPLGKAPRSVKVVAKSR